jgi:hypothetical protein
MKLDCVYGVRAKRRRKILTAEERALVLEAYRDTQETTGSIGKRFGISMPTVTRIAAAGGAPMRGQGCAMALRAAPNFGVAHRVANWDAPAASPGAPKRFASAYADRLFDEILAVMIDVPPAPLRLIAMNVRAYSESAVESGLLELRRWRLVELRRREGRNLYVLTKRGRDAGQQGFAEAA